PAAGPLRGELRQLRAARGQLPGGTASARVAGPRLQDQGDAARHQPQRRRALPGSPAKVPDRPAAHPRRPLPDRQRSGGLRLRGLPAAPGRPIGAAATRAARAREGTAARAQPPGRLHSKPA
ncbi:unnamed protein product, partial [Effrenium voratum]